MNRDSVDVKRMLRETRRGKGYVIPGTGCGVWEQALIDTLDALKRTNPMDELGQHRVPGGRG